MKPGEQAMNSRLAATLRPVWRSALSALAVLVLMTDSDALAKTVVEHQGGTDPGKGSWKLVRGEGAEGISKAEAATGDVAAWRVAKTAAKSGSVFCYHAKREAYGRTAIGEAESRGFRVTAVVRAVVSNGGHGQSIEIGTLSRRYIIGIGRAKEGHPIAYFWDGKHTAVPLPELDSGFHTWELWSAPGDPYAYLRVDGKPVGNAYAGIPAGPHGGRFIFGNNASAGFGTADYRSVQLEVAPRVVKWPAWGNPPRLNLPTLIDIRKIWDRAPHNAFTDLVRWRDRFYCAFREGKGHAGDVGKLRVIESKDGVTWKSTTLLAHPEYDLRDAALSLTPANQLLVLGGAQRNAGGKRSTGTFISLSSDGEAFSNPQMVVSLGRWLWRVTWHGDVAYGVTYGTPENREHSALIKTKDGVRYETVTTRLLSEGGWPTEARVRFDKDGTGYCLHRRDGRGNTAFLGSAKAPYTDWKWVDLGKRFGGPNFLEVPGVGWIGAGRLYDHPVRTSLTAIDVEKGTMTELFPLPSGGDTSYPGMVWHDGVLWVSYYASHEGRTSIYLARFRWDR